MHSPDVEGRSLLHLEPIGGMAGDMFLGALIDLGIPEGLVADAVAALGLDGVEVETRRSLRGGIAGIRFRVLVDGCSLEGAEPEEAAGPAPVTRPPERLAVGWDLDDIRRLLRASALEPAVRERSERLFARLAGALARTGGPGVPASGEIDRVRFEGLPGLDFLVDLVGSAAVVEHLAPSRITCTAVNVGGSGGDPGERGLPPAGPGAASLWLLRGAPIYAGGAGERLTPTGAVLLAELVDAFEPLPPMVLEAVGHGLGRFDPADRPNVVRALRGRSLEGAAWEGTNGLLARVPSGGGRTR